MSGEENAVERRASCRAAADVSDPLPLPKLQSGDDFSRQNLETWVNALAAPGLRGRRAGTRDARRAARLIADYFVSLGADMPAGADHCMPFDGPGFRDQNVVAHLRRSSNRAECGWLLIGAHYDGLGLDERERIRPGADDNATGVAVVLEAARLFATASRRPSIGLVLAAFGGEEQDLSGSRAYVKNPSVPLEQVEMMVNLDMLGRRPGGMATIGYQASGELRDVTQAHVREASATTGVNTTLARLGDRSDSASFSAQVPTLFFSTMTHADYHQSTDTPDRVDYRQVESALRLVLELAGRYDCA